MEKGLSRRAMLKLGAGALGIAAAGTGAAYILGGEPSLEKLAERYCSQAQFFPGSKRFVLYVPDCHDAEYQESFAPRIVEAQKAFRISLVGLEGYDKGRVAERWTREDEDGHLARIQEAVCEEAAQYFGRDVVESLDDYYGAQADKSAWLQKWRPRLGNRTEGIPALGKIIDVYANMIDPDRHPAKRYTTLLPASTFVGIETPQLNKQASGILSMQEVVQLRQDLELLIPQAKQVGGSFVDYLAKVQQALQASYDQGERDAAPATRNDLDNIVIVKRSQEAASTFLEAMDTHKVNRGMLIMGMGHKVPIYEKLEHEHCSYGALRIPESLQKFVRDR